MATPTTGESIYSKLFLQLVRESTPGVYDPNGQKTVMLQVKGDFVSEEQWGNFRPDGFNEDAWNALSKTHRVFNGTFQPEFRHMDLLAEMACGVDFLAVSAPTSDTVQSIVELPNMGERSIYTYTVERGTPKSCERCTYGIITALSMENDRDAANSTGSLTLLCRKPLDDAVNVAMTGGVAQNAILRFPATNVSTDGVYLVKIGDTGLAQTLTLSVGDSTTNTANKLAALGITATVAGGVNTGAGESHRLYGPAVTGNALIYGGAVTVNPSTSTPSTVTSAIQALGGSFAGRTAAGTITAPIAGGQNYIITGAGDTSYNGTYTPTGTTINGAMSYTNGSRFLYYQNLFVNQWQLANTNGAGSYAYAYASASTTPPIGSYAESGGQSSAPYPSVALGASTGGTPGVVDLTISVPSGAGNVADLDVSGAGYTATSTPPGGAGGTPIATVSSPPNTAISVTPVSGAGWGYTPQQVGSDGKFRIPKRVPMMPQMFSFLQADTRAGLDTAQPWGKVKKVGFAIDSLASLEWFFDENNLTPQSHTDNADRKTTMSVQISASSNKLVGMQADAVQQPATPRWNEIRARHNDLKHLARFQMFGSIMGAAPLQAAGNIQSHEFNIGAVLTDTPASDNSVAIICRKAV